MHSAHTVHAHTAQHTYCTHGTRKHTRACTAHTAHRLHTHAQHTHSHPQHTCTHMHTQVWSGSGPMPGMGCLTVCPLPPAPVCPAAPHALCDLPSISERQTKPSSTVSSNVDPLNTNIPSCPCPDVWPKTLQNVPPACPTPAVHPGSWKTFTPFLTLSLRPLDVPLLL